MLPYILLLLATAQAGAMQRPEPATRIERAHIDSTVTIAPGENVRLLSRFIHEGGMARLGGRRLDFIYATQIPASDVEARHAQADRAAQFFGPQAVDIGANRLSIGICDTRACAERRDPPANWFLYERGAQGWRRVR